MRVFRIAHMLETGFSRCPATRNTRDIGRGGDGPPSSYTVDVESAFDPFVQWFVDFDRAEQYSALEDEAEVLVNYQVDLIGQLERQLRAIHHTMRQIEKLRRAAQRVGRELSNGEKVDTLGRLSDEVFSIDHELATQHESCMEMQTMIGEMRGRLRVLRQATKPESASSDSEQPPTETTLGVTE